MIVRNVKRLILLIGSIVVLTPIVVHLHARTEASSWIQPTLTQPHLDSEAPLSRVHSDIPHRATGLPATIPEEAPEDASPAPSSAVASVGGVPATHHRVFSVSTSDRAFFLIDFKGIPAMNPNIIPHPTLADTWIVVAQRRGVDESLRFSEIVCNAVFVEETLSCLDEPTTLPIAATRGDKCEGEISYFNDNVGPHDARVFWGPKKPYVLFGSNSGFTCFGQFAQDLRTLVSDWGSELSGAPEFRLATELQRPSPWGIVEKNWFLFWDTSGRMYVHYEVAPHRGFAQISPDGSVGPDLAPAVQASDQRCLNKYMPKLAPELESVHQSTNSLQVTFCRRSDPDCTANNTNTFLFTIYQHKTYYGFHSVYEPYIMIFKREPPFGIYAMSQKPLWIHGRRLHPERMTSDMFYITSMSWRSSKQRYHGYLDDELFVSFGIEDDMAAGIDVLASDVLADVGLCLDV